MEDAHTTLHALESAAGSVSFFAVYDGHGGSYAANFAGKQLHTTILATEAFGAGNYPLALKDGFLQADIDLRSDENAIKEPSGCTAVGALIVDGTIYVANAGDSRAILSNNGQAVALSFDHKPTNQGFFRLQR